MPEPLDQLKESSHSIGDFKVFVGSPQQVSIVPGEESFGFRVKIRKGKLKRYISVIHTDMIIVEALRKILSVIFSTLDGSVEIQKHKKDGV